MILIVTTIDVYLAVYKDVELQQHNDEPVRRKWRPRKKAQSGHPLKTDTEADAAKQP